MKCYLVLLNFVLEPFELAVSSARHVNNDQIKLLVLQSQYSSFLTVLWFFEIFKDAERLELTENGHARVSCRAFAEIPIAKVSMNVNVFFSIDL